MSTRTVLVTGGAGYVGSHTCKALAAAGWSPVVYDNLCRGHASAVKWGPLEQGDLHDTDRLRTVIELHRPVAVLHFAAFAYVGESVTEPGLYYHNNVGGSVALLEVMRHTGLDAIIFSSSCATYGAAKSDLILETDLQTPINPYGMSKLVVERILADWERAHGLRSFILRYFNAAGCDLDGEIGESHDPEPHLIPRIIKTALGTLGSVDILGDDYPTPDGTCVRDFVHVADLARAHVLALDKLVAGRTSDTVNLGNEIGYSVREVISLVEQISGRPVRTLVRPRRPGDPPKLVASASRAREVLGWTPLHGLNAMIETALDWERRRR